MGLGTTLIILYVLIALASTLALSTVGSPVNREKFIKFLPMGLLWFPLLLWVMSVVIRRKRG